MSRQRENPSPTVAPRMRRWRLIQRTLIVIATLAGAVAIAAIFDPHGEVIPPFVWGPCIVVVCVGGVLAGVAGAKAHESSFAAAHTSIGTVIEVIEIPDSTDHNARYMFKVEAQLPDGTVLHRKLDVRGLRYPFAWVGRQVHFSHNTTDPDSLADAFFGRQEHRATMAQSSP